jgi:D-sedoheptulose 7-phosphate isomerase
MIIMKYQNKIADSIRESIETKQRVLDILSDKIEQVGLMLADAIKNGGKTMLCGNGGSAADSQHLAAELVVRLRSSFSRPAIPAIALTVDTSILTACGNDFGFDYVFSRQIEALGNKEDILIAISTSGNSSNIIQAIIAAKQKNIKVIGLLGGDGGKMKDLCDDTIIVPSKTTARIQESHIMIGHLLCEIIEEELYKS